MNLRFAAIITGCMLAGAAAAAYHRVDSRPTAQPATPLFMQAATGAPTMTAWPPSGAVAFYEEMRTLVSTGPTRNPSQQPSPQQTPQQAPQGTGAPPASNDTVEIIIRDRFGRPIRIERIDRRLLQQGYPQQGYPRPPHRFQAPQAQGPYGPFAPYR